jgi:hypothetical protein
MTTFPSRRGCQGPAPRRIASSAVVQLPRPPVPISPAGIHTSPDGSASPTQAPDRPSPPLGRFDRRPWEFPVVCSRLLAYRCALASPAAESSCPMTSDSRACRDCFPTLSRTSRSSDRPHQLLPDSPLPVCTHPKPTVWEYSTALPYSKGSSRFRLTFL